MIGPALERAQAANDLSTYPELLRIHGELLLAKGEPDSAALARAAFERAMSIAAGLHFTSWELRAATSLARLSIAQGETSRARAVLEAVYLKFAEGFETADLHAARQLLETVSVER